MKKLALILLALALASCSASPEGTTDGDCADAKDNDGDGFIDCEDDGCGLDDYCISLAVKAKIAADNARVAKEGPKPPVEIVDENAAYFELGDIWIQMGHNGKDISQRQSVLYCEGLELAGKSDWRLPTEAEAAQAANAKKLPLEALVMWTSTEKSNKRAAIVGISTGAINDLGVHSVGQCRARCVRDK